MGKPTKTRLPDKVHRSGRTKRAGTVSPLPLSFVPKFWEDADQRTYIVRTIKERIDTLRKHAGADSIQRDLLCQRAIFLALQLETAEITATETGSFDAGKYTQATNALLGILRALGLDNKSIKTVMPWRDEWEPAQVDQPAGEEK